jgi:hypothetical protein
LPHRPRARGAALRPKVDAPAVGMAERHVRNATTDFPVSGAHGLLVHSVLSAQTGLALRLVWKNMGFPTTRKEFDHFAKMLKQTAPGVAEDTLSALLRKAAAKEE